MTTYDSTIEFTVKLAARQQIAGGASTLSENITQALLASLVDQFSQDDVNYAWPEYAAGVSVPSWVDNFVGHVSSSSALPLGIGNGGLYGQGLNPLGWRLQVSQIRTNINETQVLGTPSPYGPPPQTKQYNFRSWQQ